MDSKIRTTETTAINIEGRLAAGDQGVGGTGLAETVREGGEAEASRRIGQMELFAYCNKLFILQLREGRKDRGG